MASALEVTALTSECQSFSTCCICFDEYNEELNLPKMLPCCHTFCLKCVKILVSCRCPLCCKLFRLDVIDSFPINQYALYIIRLRNQFMEVIERCWNFEVINSQLQESLKTLRAAQLESSAQPDDDEVVAAVVSAVEVPEESVVPATNAANTSAQLDTTAMSSRHRIIAQANPSVILKCRSIRVGTYKYLPIEAQCCVRISKKGFIITVPLPNDATQFHSIAILTESLLKVEAYFSPNLTVISLQVAPIVSRRESSHLRMTNRNQGLVGPKWDSLSANDCEQYLTIVPTEMSEDSRRLIKSSFRAHGVFREITRNEASRRLITAASRS